MYQHFPRSGAGRFIYIHEFYNSHSAHSMAQLRENTRSAYQESKVIISCIEASPYSSPSPELHNITIASHLFTLECDLAPKHF